MTSTSCRCGDLLRAHYAENGVEAHITTVPPIVAPAYQPLDMRCPHGVLWYAEPTGDQIAQWAKDGVA